MIRSKISPIKRLAQNSFINHVLFWGLSYFVLVNIFSNSSEIYPVDRIYTSIFMITLAIAVYINLSCLIPSHLRTGHYTFYGLLFLLTLTLGAGLNMLLFSHFIDFILPGYYFISYYTIWDLLKFFGAFLAVSSLLKLSKEWFQLVASKQQLAELEKEKVEIELKALRAQVNPHFLFNTLNVLYTLALNRSEKTPEVIIQLSDLLRYVTYHANKEQVKLSEEVTQIYNYINLQRHRMEDISKIAIQTHLQNDPFIPPMLLIPLVENAFKHGLKGEDDEMYIHINLVSSKHNLHFQIENNRIEQHEPDDDSHGVGLANIKNRLALLYPSRHVFRILENETIFKITLEINL